MDFLTDVLTFPVMGPIRGLVWIAEKVMEEAERELYDEGAVRGRLQVLALQLDMGEISEEEYYAAEETLLARLRDIRRVREE